MKRLSCCFVLLLCTTAPAAAQDMPLSEILVSGEGWKAIPGTFEEIASLAADRQGNVYIADPARRRIDRIDPQGKVAAFHNAKDPIHGICFASDGKLYGCQPSRRRIVVIGSEEMPVVENIDATSLVVTRHGVIYCTVPRDLAVYRIEPGQVRRRVDEAVVAPAAVTLWPDEGTLIIGYPASAYLWACRIDKDGSLSGKDRYYSLRLAHGKTGSAVAQMTEDEKRRLYAATEEGVQIYDPTGRMSGVLLKPERAPVSAVTIGGADHSTLYIGCGHQVFARRITTKGAFPVVAK
jgi:enterochelin esterase family protein